MSRHVAILLPLLLSVLIFGAVLWFMTGGGREVRFLGAWPAADAPRHFSAEEIAQGKAYVVERRVSAVAGLLLGPAVLAVFLVFGGAVGMRDACSAVSGGRPWLTVSLYAGCLGLLLTILYAPLDFYGGYVLQHRLGLSVQTIGGYVLDATKGLIVAGVIAIPLAVVLYAVIARVESWWIPAALGSGALILVLTVLGPVVIAPLFNTFTQLPESPLRGKIVSMARESGMTVEDVYVMDASRRTRGGNAYVTGLGRTKRIVLYDTLLQDMTFEEAVSVVAHELGHWNRKHLWIQISLAAASSLAGFTVAGILLRTASNREWFGITRPDDPAGLPFLLLVGMVLSLAVLPADRALSRTMERQADWSSLLIAGDSEGFIALERRLALMNKGDITPPGWVRTILASHPPVLERIGMAEEWKNGESVSR